MGGPYHLMPEYFLLDYPGIILTKQILPVLLLQTSMVDEPFAGGLGYFLAEEIVLLVQFVQLLTEVFDTDLLGVEFGKKFIEFLPIDGLLV